MKRLGFFLPVIALLLGGCWGLEVSWDKPATYENGDLIPDHTVLKCQIEWHYVGLPASETDPEDLKIMTYHLCNEEVFQTAGMDGIPYNLRIRAREVYELYPDLVRWGEWSETIYVPAPEHTH